MCWGGGGRQTDRFKYNLLAYRSSLYILVFVTLKGKGTEEASLDVARRVGYKPENAPKEIHAAILSCLLKQRRSGVSKTRARELPFCAQQSTVSVT